MSARAARAGTTAGALVWLALASACGAARPSAARAPRAPRARGDVEVLLTTRELGESAIAVDDTAAFVVTWHGVTRVEKDGGAAVDLVDEPMGGVIPGVIALDAARVFFVRRAPCEGVAPSAGAAKNSECARIFAAPKRGGAAREVCDVAPEVTPAALAVGGGAVYFGERDRVMRAPVDGGAALVAARADGEVEDVAFDGERLYWVEGDADGASAPGAARSPGGARLVAREGGRTRVVGPADAGKRAYVAFDAGRVYWIADSKVWRADKRGGAPEAIAEARSRDGHLAADDAGTAWSEPVWATIARRASSGAVERVVLRGARPAFVALDRGAIYATAVGDEDGAMRVVRLPR